MKKLGKKGIDILQLNRKELVDLLNKAYADEWLAYYQYWVGAKVISGLMRPAAVAELEQHAADELRHAGLLTDRIIQLGGKPITNPNQWERLANCQYAEPIRTDVKSILKQGIEGERCAIEVYNHLLDLTRNKDEITYQLILSILKDEIEHETDFMTLLEDLS